MADDPSDISPDCTPRALADYRRRLLAENGLDGPHLSLHVDVRDRLYLEARQKGTFQGRMPDEEALDPIGLPQTLAFAEAYFDRRASCDWRQWLSSGAGPEAFARQLAALRAHVLGELENIWSSAGVAERPGARELRMRWFERTCRPAVESTLAKRVEEWKRKTRDYPRWMFHRREPAVIVRNEEEEAALGTEWSRKWDPDLYQPPAPDYRMLPPLPPPPTPSASADYPRMLFHRQKDPVTVQSEAEEEAALGAGWSREFLPRDPEPVPPTTEELLMKELGEVKEMLKNVTAPPIRKASGLQTAAAKPPSPAEEEPGRPPAHELMKPVKSPAEMLDQIAQTQDYMRRACGIREQRPAEIVDNLLQFDALLWLERWRRAVTPEEPGDAELEPPAGPPPQPPATPTGKPRKKQKAVIIDQNVLMTALNQLNKNQGNQLEFGNRQKLAKQLGDMTHTGEPNASTWLKILNDEPIRQDVAERVVSFFKRLGITLETKQLIAKYVND